MKTIKRAVVVHTQHYENYGEGDLNKTYFKPKGGEAVWCMTVEVPWSPTWEQDAKQAALNCSLVNDIEERTGGFLVFIRSIELMPLDEAEARAAIDIYADDIESDVYLSKIKRVDGCGVVWMAA